MIANATDWSVILGVGGLLVGIGGLVHSGLTAYWNHRERVQPFRQRLYDLKLDAYHKIIPILYDCADVGRSGAFYEKHRESIPPEVRQRNQKRREDMSAKLMDTVFKSAVFIPEEIVRKTALLANFVLFSEADRGELDQAYDEISKAIREDLLIDPLSDDTQNMINRLRSKREHAEQ